jgi:hypothetical protein
MAKKMFWIALIMMVIGVNFVFAQNEATGKVKAAIASFEQYGEPKNRGKVTLTGSDRTWEDQMKFCLERPTQYPNITQDFSKKFNVILPSTPDKMTYEMRAWWKDRIMAQAGRSPGFPHVGGKAQDIWIAGLDDAGKANLKTILENNGLGVLAEYISGGDSQYGVPLTQANVFHCYIK